MTERGYAAAKALARDPGATPEERDTARRRCAEHEAQQRAARAAAAPPRAADPDVDRRDMEGVDPWLRYFHGDRDFSKRIIAIEFEIRMGGRRVEDLLDPRPVLTVEP